MNTEIFSGLIGLWWFYKKVYSFKTLIKDGIKTDQEIISNRETHAELWPQCKALYTLPGTLFHEIPRGRVVFDLNHSNFIVFGPDALICSLLFQNSIVDEFKIPSQASQGKNAGTIVFLKSTHYEDYKKNFLKFE